MATALVKSDEKMATVGKWLTDTRVVQRFRDALPASGLTAERLLGVVMTECRTNPKLLNCTLPSLLGATMEAAQVGLTPGVNGECYLIPYGKDATFVPGYRGLVQLAWRSEQIQNIQCQVVYANDHFDYAFGLPPKLEHRPVDGERGDPVQVYAAVMTTSGGAQFDVWPWEKCMAHGREHSRSFSSGPWKTHPEAMAKKTVLRQVLKLAPCSTDVQRLISLDERAEAGIDQGLTFELPEGDPEPAAAPEGGE